MKLHPWRTHLLALAGSCLALTTGHALADCGPGQTTVFSCLTAKGKRIQVCDAGATIDYSFGKPDAPAEIVVRAPRAQAATSQWSGVGRYISYSVMSFVMMLFNLLTLLTSRSKYLTFIK